jgi:hypothetical protein
VAGLAVPAAAARPLRLECDPLADAGRVHSLTRGDDVTAHLVSEHQRGLDNE